MRKSKIRFFIGLLIAISILSTSVVGGYLIINNILVPQYFSQYGINSLNELVNVVQTIYIVPDEKDFITNGFSSFDKENAISKLTTAGFPTLKNGGIDYDAIARRDFSFSPDSDFVDNFVVLSDKELATIVTDIIDAGLLATNYPGLDAIDTLNMELKQIIITPKKESLKINEKQFLPETDEKSAERYIKSTTYDANIKLTIMLDTISARQQICSNLNMPKFLVDWIIPDYIYVTCQMDTYKNENGERLYDNTNIAINSKTPKQSEVLLKLLLSFIYPENSYTPESFSNELSSLAIQGINMLGQIEFAYFETASSIQSGVKLTIF